MIQMHYQWKQLEYTDDLIGMRNPNFTTKYVWFQISVFKDFRKHTLSCNTVFGNLQNNKMFIYNTHTNITWLLKMTYLMPADSESMK